jgi:hypothetical protein
MPKTKEQKEKEIKFGYRDEDVYTEEGRELAEEEGEITNVEEGFMEGYENKNSPSNCANCKKSLSEDFVEEEFHGDVLRFCSETCATEYEKTNK